MNAVRVGGGHMHRAETPVACTAMTTLERDVPTLGLRIQPAALPKLALR